jgi:predicted transcriptional regulator
MMSNNLMDFFELFKKFEMLISLEYNGGENSVFGDKLNYAIAKDKRLNQYKEKLVVLSRLRNVYAHNSANNLYQITDDSIIILREVINIIQNPIKAYQKSSKLIKYAKLEDTVLYIIKEMKKNKFSYFPVLENEKLIGVFSSDVIGNIYATENEIIIDDNLKMGDIKRYIDTKNHLNEKFVFVKRDDLLSYIEELFVNSYKQSEHKYIGCAFVTHNGIKTEKILGIITIWDILDY